MGACACVCFFKHNTRCLSEPKIAASKLPQLSVHTHGVIESKGIMTLIEDAQRDSEKVYLAKEASLYVNRK